MALSFKRLAATFVSRLMLGNSYPRQHFRASSLWRVGHFHALFHSYVLFEGGVGTNNNEFQRWHNGGGTFHKSAQIDPTAVVDVGAAVHSKAIVGANVHIGSGAVIGTSVTIGQSTKIWYNVALSNCTIGDLCVIHNRVCIGQDAFGFMVDDHGTMIKKPQMLNARIGNDVEIGANKCIDRGSGRDTIIGDHKKIDYLVQIGHNVVIGKKFHALWSCWDCRFCNVRLAAANCVTKDIKIPVNYGGFPAVPTHEWRRQVAMLSRASKKRNH